MQSRRRGKTKKKKKKRGILTNENRNEKKKNECFSQTCLTIFSPKSDGYAIGVAYFRSGYTPNDYPTEKEWSARLILERSSAIKCPNIQYHLLGTKKVQQIWATKNLLEKYLPKSEAEFLRTCFAGQYSLDPDDHPEEVRQNKFIFCEKICVFFCR